MSSCPRDDTSSVQATHRGHRADDSGFTLIEVMVSMLVLTIGLVGIAAMLALTTQMHIGARENARSTRLAQDKFDELMKLNFASDPRVAVGGDLTSNVANYSDTPTTGVTLRWVVEAGPTDDTRSVTVRVLNEASQQYRQTDLSTIIRQW